MPASPSQFYSAHLPSPDISDLPFSPQFLCLNSLYALCQPSASPTPLANFLSVESQATFPRSFSSLPAAVRVRGTECHPAVLDPTCSSGHPRHGAALQSKFLVLLGKVHGSAGLYVTILPHPWAVKRSKYLVRIDF